MLEHALQILSARKEIYHPSNIHLILNNTWSLIMCI